METVYQIPQVIRDLEAIGKEYDEFYGLRALGFYIDVNSDRYAITPADSIPFAWTGGDGIHFAFLTDFGTTTDLLKAPIVCVSPSNDPPLNLVAPDIYSFLAIVCKIKEAESLDGLRFTDREAEWLDEIVSEQLGDEDNLRAANLLSSVLMERLNLEEPASVYDVIQSARAERAKAVCIETLDGLGVVGTLEAGGGKPRIYDFNAEGAKELAKIREFSEKASYVEKLALCRDAQYSCIFAKDYDHEIQLLIAEMLESMGLTIEAQRVRDM
jgi:hypothetical protein